jgi:hypothetical protein
MTMSLPSLAGRIVKATLVATAVIVGTVVIRRIAPHIEKLLRRLFPPGPTEPPFFPPSRELLVVNMGSQAVIGFEILQDGTIATTPARVIRGPATGIDNPIDVAVDSQRRICVVNLGGNSTPSILVWEQLSNGNTPPRWSIPQPGPLVHPFPLPTSITVRRTPRRILITESHSENLPAVLEYHIENAASPTGQLSGLNTGLTSATSVAVGHTEIYVADPVAGAVRVYLAFTDQNLNLAPVRVISGPASRLRTPYRLTFHRPSSSLFVLDNPRTVSSRPCVYVYPEGAGQNTGPIRRQGGPLADQAGMWDPLAIAVDRAGRVYLADGNSITVYSATASISSPPEQVLRHPLLNAPVGIAIFES